MFNPISKMQNPAGLYSMVTQLPSQQQQPELNQLSQTGLAPTEAILYVKNQLDRLRAARQAPPPTTVMQDMQAQIQQAQMPQMQAPLQSPAQSPIQPASQGLPSLPVQNVGQPQNYAGGGIVAFTQGGPTMYVNPEGGVSSSLPPRNLPATIGRGASAAEDPAAFWKTVTEFMKRGASQSEAIAKAETVMGSLKAGARLAGRFAGPVGLGLSSLGAVSNLADEGGNKDLLVKYLRNAGLTYDDYLNLSPQSQAAFGQMVGSARALSGMTGLNLTGEGDIGGRSTAGPTSRARVTGVGRKAELAGIPTVAPRREASGTKAVAPEAPVAVAQPKKTQADYLAEIEALGREKGIGKAISDREKVLAARQAASEKDLADRSRMSRAQAFFKMAEESAKPGGTFLKGATAGLSQYAEAKQAMADRRQALQERAEDLQFTIAQAKEQQALGNMEAARRLFEKAKADEEQLAKEARENAQRMKELDFQATARMAEIQAQGTQRAQELATAKTARETLERQLAAESDPAKRAVILARLRELAMLSPTYLAAEERYKSNPFGEIGMDQTGWSAQERK